MSSRTEKDRSYGTDEWIERGEFMSDVDEGLLADGNEPPSAWRVALSGFWLASEHSSRHRFASAEVGGAEVLYRLRSVGDDLFLIQTFARERSQGKWSKPTELPMSRVKEFPRGSAHRVILEQLYPFHVRPEHLIQSPYDWSGSDFSRSIDRVSQYELRTEDLNALLPSIAKTGGLYFDEIDETQRLGWHEGPSWRLVARIVDDAGANTFSVVGFLQRGEDEISLERASFFVGELVCIEHSLHRFDSEEQYSWIHSLVAHQFDGIPSAHRDDFLREVLALDLRGTLDLPEGWKRTLGTPRGRAVIQLEATASGGRKRPRLLCVPYFDYGDGVMIDATDSVEVAKPTSAPGAEFVLRNIDAERKLVSQLFEAGVRRGRGDHSLKVVSVTQKQVPQLVQDLVDRGWIVEAEDKVYRGGASFTMSVASRRDWLEIKGGASFDGEHVPYARLLVQIKRGSNLVKLGDGTTGVLPADWLRRAGMMLTLGEGAADDDGEEVVRYSRNQAWLLDALLAEREHEQAQVDGPFQRYRDRLASFDGISAKRERRSLKGTLRDYQREGLGWLLFLRDFGVGGCLADDMGLGKTVQVLALFEELRVSKRAKGPQLVVAPRSVLGNWAREAERFVPGYRVSEYDATTPRTRLSRSSILLVSYDMMRRNIVELSKIEFDVVVLDEAQMIKNARSQTAKAARLLRAHQRLALSGTPVENHLGELWSLLDFLNRGMLGKATAFRKLLGDSNSVGLDNDGRSLLARSVRPFILRRTKDTVLSELPEKTEQTIYCEMSDEQRSLYNELKQYYRARLLADDTDMAVQAAGSGGKLQVLEALLRLRQAACHPGLLDSDRGVTGESAKLSVLLEKLHEVIAEGHKVLVFSQFTKLLGIVRDKLVEEGIDHAYLDGKTRKRDQIVDRFQTDPDCSVFLISLKAGGLGLNLTAADYVFILDPWWNPAVEAQAIDRAHRIGQVRSVFAYRLITKETVEEKIVELQQDKRDIASSIIRADDGLLKRLTRDDLELLLG